MRRIEILVEGDEAADFLEILLSGNTVKELVERRGGKIEGIANLDADSVPASAEDSPEEWEEIVPTTLPPTNGE